MASYVVMEPPAAAGRAGGEDRAVLVRDGFHVLAFLLPAVWLLFHRLWIEALFVVAVSMALSGIGSVAGLGSAAPALLVSLYVGLEGSALKLAALRRRGWREWGVVEADNAADAEIRYLSEAVSDADDADEPASVWPSAGSLPPPAAPRRESGPVLGLFAYPGKS